MAKFAAAALAVTALCSGFASVQSELKEGDSCVETSSGKSGVCTVFSSCPAALKNWRVDKVRPTVCGYGRGKTVVCCESIPKTKTTKRISQLKCEEYSKPVTETVYGSALTSDAKPVGLIFSNCSYDKIQLVVGGEPALPGQFPHMVAIGWPLAQGGHGFNCGGSLISNRFVLTAGHCFAVSLRNTEVTSIEPTLIRLGDLDLRQDQDDGAKPIDVRIKRIVKHPDYQPPSTYNDIALLEMERSVEFNSFVRPACLWQRNDFGMSELGIVTGWGAIAYRGARSDVLLKVKLKLFSNELCQPLLSKLINRRWKKGFSKEQMCAGDLEGKHDSCQGDSGGPLQVTMEDNHCIYYVMGITSFGDNCGLVNGPGVYTRVSSFIPWIESVVWSDGV